MTDASAQHEENLVAASRGKWSQPGVPHRGWHCIDIEDLGYEKTQCEMCESRTIRFVHNMAHPDYPAILAVGCICAGHMEENRAAARTREAAMKSRDGKRKRWLLRKWRVSQKGNPWLRSDGFVITIFNRSGGWAVVMNQVDQEPIFSRKTFTTQEEAKMAAFDHITKLKAVQSAE